MSKDHPSRYVVVGVTPGQSEAVLLHAALFARHFDASLVCASVDLMSYKVAEFSDGSVDSRPIDPDSPDWEATVFDRGLAQHIHQVLRNEHVELIFRQLAGDCAYALGRLADALQAEMIVVGSRHHGIRSGISEYLGGSVAAHLAHRQHRPVVVVPISPVPPGQRLPWEDAS